MNGQINKERLIDKIRKLVALSASANEHEAALAAEKAQALCAAYNLTMADLGSADTDRVSEMFVTDMDIKTDSVPWRRRIAHAVAQMYFCTYFVQFRKEATRKRQNGYIRYDCHTFVGAEHNITVAKLMFIYLAATTERWADEGSLAYPIKERSAYKTSFKMACALRLVSRIMLKIEEGKRGQLKSETGTKLPALLNLYESTQKRLQAHIEQEYGQMRSGRSLSGVVTMVVARTVGVLVTGSDLILRSVRLGSSTWGGCDGCDRQKRLIQHRGLPDKQPSMVGGPPT
jgi:hypothetical protein